MPAGGDPSFQACQGTSGTGSGAIVVTGSVGEQDALAEQVGFSASVHLSLDHLDAVDVAFDSAGAVGDGEPGGDGGQSLRSPLAKPRSSLTGLSWAWLARASRRSPRRLQSMSANSRTRAPVCF